ncbi:MAG: hypothetical protein WKF83_17920 [Nocardioidaceae bacterium]
MTIAPPERRPALEKQLALLAGAASVAADSDADREAALVPDPSGIGSAEELVTCAPAQQQQ